MNDNGPKATPRLFKCKELGWIIQQNDYGLAPKKMEVLAAEGIETISDLNKKWKSLHTKSLTVSDFHLREAYMYLFYLGEYVEGLSKDVGEDYASIWYQHEDFHFTYLRTYLFAAHKPSRDRKRKAAY